MQGMPTTLPESFSQNPTGADIGLWPLAWGWWVLIIVSLMAIVGLIIWIRHYYTSRVFLRLAIREVQNISNDSSDLKAACNQILKRTFMSYFPVDTVAQLHGEKWSRFIQNQLTDKNKIHLNAFLTYLANGFYQKHTSSELPAFSDAEFATATITLMKQALPPSNKQLQLLEAQID